MLTLTRESHFIFPGAPILSLSAGEVNLTRLIHFAANHNFFYERPNYRLENQGVVILQTDDVWLAVNQYLEQMALEISESESKISTQETQLYSWIDCIEGQIRVTTYFQEQALQTLVQQGPNQWVTLFDCGWDENNSGTDGWPSELDYKQYEIWEVNLIQQIEEIPHATDQYPIRVPAVPKRL